MMLRWLLVSVLLVSLPAQAAEFAVVQSAAPTSNGGTQDLTSTGFGTPKCALFWGGMGTANGTAATHTGLWIGAYDGTTQRALGFGAENGQGPTDTGSASNTTNALISVLSTDQSVDGTGAASWITDGARLTWADAPPSAYLVNALLVGGSGVSNCAVGGTTTSATQDATTNVTAPGFQPDLVILFSNNNNTSSLRASVGFGWNNGGSVVQRSVGFNNTTAAGTSTVQSILATNRIVSSGVSGLAAVELSAFTANGFDVITRDAASALTFTYIAIKLNGLSAYLGTSASPAGTGSQSITGVGFRPQVGLMLQGEFAAVDTIYSSDDGEVFGLSAFTSSASGSSAFYSEDGAATSIEESMTDTKVCNTRKDSAAYNVCTFTSFDSDGATFNYTTSGGAKQRAVLFVQAPAVATRPRSGGIFLP